MLLVIALFTARIAGLSDLTDWIGIVSLFVVIPLAYLFVVGLRANQRLLYFIWLSLMILFALVEMVVDYILKVEFRDVQWAVVLYVMFFFGATGGMIGVAAEAGKRWAVLTTIVFIAMVALAFVQRAVTGL